MRVLLMTRSIAIQAVAFTRLCHVRIPAATGSETTS